MIQKAKKIYCSGPSPQLESRNRSIKDTMDTEEYKKMSSERILNWKNEHPEEYAKARENNKLAQQKESVKQKKRIGREKWIQDCLTSGRYEFLRGKTFYKKQYITKSERWTHDHCEFCWETFTEDSEGTAHVGFTTADRYYWICDACFEQFKKAFDFQLGSDPD